MNYAEDRLDRRSNDRGGRDGLRRDLERSRSLLLRGHASITDDDDDGGEDDEPARLRQIRRDGHSLAGRTLRDSGRCREACHHFARAWIECPDDAMAAGDYAQMAELAGFPEVGAVAILFYRSGGTPRDVDEGLGTSSPPWLLGLNCDEDGDDDDEEGEDEGGPCRSLGGRCGEYAPEEGAGDDVVATSPQPSSRLSTAIPPCRVPFHIEDAKIVLEALGDYDRDGGRRDAVDDDGVGGAADSGFLTHGVCRFWEDPYDRGVGGRDCLDTCCNDGNDGDGGDREADPVRSVVAPPPFGDSPGAEAALTPPPHDSTTMGGADRHTHRPRSLPPVVQLLLLKLLYSSPTGGPFLRLACEAVVGMSRGTTFGNGTALASRMARDYKSHWAYFVFVRYLVIGERVKPHRRNRRGGVPYHIPVGHIVRGVDERRFVAGVDRGNDGPPVEPVVEGPSGGGHNADDGAMSMPRQGSECGSDDDHFGQFLEAFLQECSTRGEAGALCPHGPFSPCSMRYQPRMVSKSTHPPLFFVGDSHVLSAAWQSIHVSTTAPGRTVHSRTIVPVLVTGLKAWHCRPRTRFFTYHNLISALGRLPSTARTIVLSAGEIDVREGIGGKLLENYYDDCSDAVLNTTREYVGALTALLSKPMLPDECEAGGGELRPRRSHSVRQILVTPVAPHAYRSEKNGKAVGRARRRERTVLWNDSLRVECAKRNAEGIYFLDYEDGLRCDDPKSPVGFVLDRAYNADYTHVNSAFLPLLESALSACGCNLDLI